MDVKDNPFLNFLDLSTTEDNFSEDLKLESSGLETGDIANVSSGTTEKDVCGACPLVLSFLEMLTHLSGTLIVLE